MSSETGSSEASETTRWAREQLDALKDDPEYLAELARLEAEEVMTADSGANKEARAWKVERRANYRGEHFVVCCDMPEAPVFDFGDSEGAASHAADFLTHLQARADLVPRLATVLRENHDWLTVTGQAHTVEGLRQLNEETKALLAEAEQQMGGSHD